MRFKNHESFNSYAWYRSPINILSTFPKYANGACFICHKRLSNWYKNIAPMNDASLIKSTQKLCYCFVNVMSSFSLFKGGYFDLLKGMRKAECSGTSHTLKVVLSTKYAIIPFNFTVSYCRFTKEVGGALLQQQFSQSPHLLSRTSTMVI